MLGDLGAIIIDADQVAREVVEPGKPLLNEIAKQFGEKVLTAEGKLNRQLLAAEIFNDEEKRNALSNLIHPVIIATIDNEINRIAAKDPGAIIIIEAPLLVETGMTDMADEVWITEVKLEIQIERIMNRDGLNYENALKRIKSQITNEDRRAYGTIIFNTEKSLEELKIEIKKEWERILNNRSKNNGLVKRP